MLSCTVASEEIGCTNTNERERERETERDRVHKDTRKSTLNHRCLVWFDFRSLIIQLVPAFSVEVYLWGSRSCRHSAINQLSFRSHWDLFRIRRHTSRVLGVPWLYFFYFFILNRLICLYLIFLFIFFHCFVFCLMSIICERFRQNQFFA